MQAPSPDLSVAHRAFRVISTASKSLPLKDWLSDEHANMFFPVAAQPMSHAEEEHLLLQTGCPAPVVDALLRFADRYRTSMTADAVQKNRKLGTRALMRIARRAAQFPSVEPDLCTLLSRAVLAEFLRRSLDPEPDRRYAEAGQMLHAWRRVRGPAERVEQRQRWWRRVLRPVLGAGAGGGQEQ